MSRLGGAFWFILVIVSGATNFVVKQKVQTLDDQLNSVRHQAVAEQKKIHELTADWTVLNQPELLASLNNRYVHLVQMSPKQVVASADALPLRPVPPPSLDVAPPVAEAAPPPFPPPVLPTAAVVPVSVVGPPRPPIAAPIAAAAARPQAAPPTHSASLDGLFAQVTGDR
jgi:hypothetical protein